ncbi:MAG TPA: hypothetical protein VF649_06735 [Sphingomonas sp.]|jgi:hypothetical protein|uniref:hypothetical protein n=1 Tax=Sphingomonas sp. TaxID=28214 RepID=UPI002ED7A3CE
MTFVAAALLMLFMALAAVQIVASAALACADHPDIPADRRLILLLSMIFYITVGLGLFVLAGDRFARLMLA